MKLPPQFAPSLEGVDALVVQSSNDAGRYLGSVARTLRNAGDGRRAHILERVLAQGGSLAERIAANRQKLHAIFPESAQEWRAFNARSHVAGVGWEAKEPARQLQHLTGNLSVTDGRLILTDDGGRVFRLAEAIRNSANTPIPRAWMQGLVGDGAVTVQGKLADDGVTFNVEGFALNTDGAFDTLTFGRVAVQQGRITIDTPQGRVEVESPSLEAKLLNLDTLGVALPGAPQLVESADGGQRLVYRGLPREMMVLLAFRQRATASSSNDELSVPGEMATGRFSGKPVMVPATFVDRVSHTRRVWGRGDFVLGADGTPQSFVTSYVSKATDGYQVQMSPALAEASPLQAAVVLADF